jgi:hypothetical protein
MPAPTYPRPDRLPWILFAVSAGALAWGIVTGSAGLVTLGTIGIALTVLAFAVAPRLLGHHDSEPPPTPRDAGRDDLHGT